MKKIQIISDRNQKSLKIKSQLMKILTRNKLSKSNITIVIGGDEYASNIKKNKNSKNYFMELTQKLWFFNEQIFLKILFKIYQKQIRFNLTFRNDCKNNKNQTRKSLAINEVSILDKVDK